MKLREVLNKLGERFNAPFLSDEIHEDFHNYDVCIRLIGPMKTEGISDVEPVSVRVVHESKKVFFIYE